MRSPPIRPHALDCAVFNDHPCDCGWPTADDREVPLKSPADYHGDGDAPTFSNPLTVQSVTQTRFGTMVLDTHGQMYELRYHNESGDFPDTARYTLHPITFTMKES